MNSKTAIILLTVAALALCLGTESLGDAVGALLATLAGLVVGAGVLAMGVLALVAVAILGTLAVAGFGALLVAGVAALAIAMVVALIPALAPFALLGLAIWLLMRRKPAPQVSLGKAPAA